MEAAVLPPATAAMMAVDCNSNTLTAELEVKKLQRLVLRLERQNQQLRSRASELPGLLPALPGGEDEGEDGGSEASVLDDLELLDLDSALEESDETWLYVPSKLKEAAHDISPLQWCRQVLDSPKSEVQAARRSLSLHLEQGRSLRHSLFSPESSVDSDLGSSEVDEDSIDFGYKLQDLTDVQVMARLQEESLRQDYAGTSSLRSKARSFSFQHSAGLGLEEEGEEDDEDSVFPPPRLSRLPHSHTFSSIRDWQRSPSPLSTPPSSPSVQPHPYGALGFPTHFRSRHQGLSSRGEQPAFRPGSDKLGRSMPNLFRAPSVSSVPLHSSPSSSPSLLRNSHSFDSSSFARLQPSSQLQHRVQSVGNFASSSRQPRKATAYVSPTIKSSASSLPSLSSSGIPMPSKALGGDGAASFLHPAARCSRPGPAPFGASGLAPCSKATHRSLLIPPKSLSSLSALRDASWRDGCY